MRDSLCVYSNTRFSVWRFLLESACLTVEVFLHGWIGTRYLSIPKAIVGVAFIYFAAFLASFSGISVEFRLDPRHIGFVSFWESLLATWAQIGWSGWWSNLGDFFDNMQKPAWRESVWRAISLGVVLYSVAVNFHLVWNFINRHWTPPRLWHPRSSGEPWWFIWDSFYMLFHQFNVRIDVIKGILEPLLCYCLGLLLSDYLPGSYTYVGAWLRVAAVALVIRAYLENKERSRMVADVLGNEFDARAFELQDHLYSDQPRGRDFVETKGR